MSAMWQLSHLHLHRAAQCLEKAATFFLFQYMSTPNTNIATATNTVTSTTIRSVSKVDLCRTIGATAV